MKTAMLAILAAAGTGALAKNVEIQAGPVVTVCMDRFADSTVAYLAQSEATQIFSGAGVRIAWKTGRACEAADVIRIQLSDHTPDSLKPGALAYALPYEGHRIEVFYDRVTNAVCAATLPHLLAHVLVHELAHILQGAARHSETGIMKAHWNSEDYHQMSIRPLVFTAEDIQLLQAGIEYRGRTVQAANVAVFAPAH